ncbi:MAG: 1-acyl-sn-glycerol-3-phosphate acyltransferase [Anaerolineae bacterium]
MQERKRTLLQRLAEAILNLFGWRIAIEQMPPERAVIVGAHHTSAWDVPIALLLLVATGTSFALIVKKEMFVGPLGWILRSLNCIPIDRSKRNSFVQQMVEALRGPRPVRIALGPEGTRKKTRYWKTGFYYMALGANVPMSFGYADYPRRIVGFGPTLTPSGDIQADMEIIRAFYRNIVARHPECQSDMELELAPAPAAEPRPIPVITAPRPGRLRAARDYTAGALTVLARLPVAAIAWPIRRPRTFFAAPRPMSQHLALAIARLVGWKLKMEQVPPEHCVIIGAPHTTGWDLLLAVLLRYGINIPFQWMAKDELFVGPLGWLLRSVGGIPVNRRQRNNLVDQMVERLKQPASLRLAIAPEGTRVKSRYWKSGFYYMATGAGVPIVLGYADYARREVGLGPLLHPSGDLAADIHVIARFYADKTGKFPDRQSTIEVAPLTIADEATSAQNPD